MFYADEGPNAELFAESDSLGAIYRPDTVVFALQVQKINRWWCVTWVGTESLAVSATVRQDPDSDYVTTYGYVTRVIYCGSVVPASASI